MKTRILISFMAAALWLLAAPADAEQYTAGTPNSTWHIFAMPDAHTLDQGAPNVPDSARDVSDNDGRVVEPHNSGRSATTEDDALTQDIRREVTKNDSLSTMAQNIRIISVDGMVTLRGPVASEVERNQVAALAELVAGNGKVQNHLEIAR